MLSKQPLGLVDTIPTTCQMTKHEYTKALIKSSNGILTVSKNKRMRVQNDQSERKISNTVSYWETYTAVRLLLRGCDLPAMLLKASIREATSPQSTGHFTLTPTISVSRIVPTKSEVFQCALMGRLDGLIQLLHEGKASLHDRDERGASILHVRDFQNPYISKS